MYSCNKCLQIAYPSPTFTSMKSANPRIQSLKQLLALEEKRTAIQGQLDAIDQSISSLKRSVFAGSPGSASAGERSSPKVKLTGRPVEGKKAGRSSGRKTHRDIIMAALEAAGAAGVRVKDLAVAMKTKPVNIHSWFHSNLNRIPSIKKITTANHQRRLAVVEIFLMDGTKMKLLEINCGNRKNNFLAI